MGDASRIAGQVVGARGAGSAQEYGGEGVSYQSSGRPQQHGSQQVGHQAGGNMIPGEEQSDGPFSMGPMASTLPGYRPSQNFSPTPGIPRLPPGMVTAQAQQQHQHQQHISAIPQYGGQQMHNSGNLAGFPPPFMPPMNAPHHANVGGPPYVMHQTAHQGRGGGLQNSGQQSFSGQHMIPIQQTQSSQYMYYPPMYGNVGQGYPGGGQRHLDNYVQQSGVHPLASGGMQSASVHGMNVVSRQATSSDSPRRPNTMTSAGSIPAAPRGPPRKPRQSGHALWVGNLPPGAKVTDLKDHFSRDATEEIESVFLISKSNCAFVNYRSEDACSAAMSRFHESRFQGVRLVCRLRRTNLPASVSSATVPTGPAASSPGANQSQTAVEAINQNRQVSSKAEESLRQIEGAGKINDKYFIVKSLTLEDLELSARTGVWATQSHNEDALNRAFESVDSVYLVFSANKSGEYFGYARMISPISEEVAKDLDWTPRAETVIDDSDLPRAIPTPATETAPKGQIIDDSARGTIFWEAESLDDDDVPADKGIAVDVESEEKVEDDEQVSEVQAFGRPFKIEWVSTSRLPFYRTRGLRNPWNANREVKIARDGTELETSVGRRLVEMFHRPPVTSQQPASPGIYLGMRPF